MESIVLCCSRCGATNFANMAGLMGHMKNSSCRILGQMTSIPLSPVPHISSHSLSPLTNSHIVPDEHGASMDSLEMLHPLEMIKETPVALQYDATFEIIRFFRSCNNNEGLSNKDKDCLLSILWHQEFDTSKLTIYTSSDIKQYEEQLYSEEDGWQSYTLSQKENEVPVVFQFKDPMVALTNLFSSPEVAEDFKLRPSIVRNESGERVYSSLDTCEWWEEMQIYINLKCEGAIIVPIILYSDQTTLSNNRRVLGHPIVMSIGNISCHVRELDEGHTLIGLLPIFSDMNVSQDQKLEMFQECLDIIFKPLKVASHEGVALIDPFGTPQFVFPLLYAYSCDHPEGCKISCTYDTNKSSSPCSNCMCGKDSLSDVHLTFRSRTEEKMKEIYCAMTSNNLPRGESKKISKSWSIHPVECAFWNFNGGDTRLGNPYLAIHVDILHQSDVGIFKMLVDIIREMVPPTTLTQLDQRLLHIHDKCRYPGFRIPGSAKGGYFTSNANYAGFEHRAIMQVLMFCLIGLYDLSIIEVFAFFMDWYSLACRSIEHTDRSLLQMEASMNRVVSAMKRSNLSDWQRSAFNTIKVHMMSHFDPCIRRSGLPWEYSTNMFEHMHIALMKKAYRRSNKRNAALQIIKHNRRLEMLRTVGKQLQGFENIQVQRETILDKAVTLEVNVMSGAYVNIHRSWLTQDARDVSQTPRTTMSDIQMGRGFDVATLPKKVQHLFHHQPEVPNYLSHALHSFELERGIQLPQVFGVSKTLAIPGGLGGRYGESPLYVRASHSFYGRPWYSSVALKMENPSEPETTWYGEVHLLMHFSLLDLALVKCYCELDEGELGHTLKCIELSWSIPHDYTCAQVKRAKRPEYIVVEASKILRVVHVVPHFGQCGHFFVNKWKF